MEKVASTGWVGWHRRRSGDANIKFESFTSQNTLGDGLKVASGTGVVYSQVQVRWSNASDGGPNYPATAALPSTRCSRRTCWSTTVTSAARATRVRTSASPSTSPTIAAASSPTRTRTWDMVINSHPLYQLSYRGMEGGV